MIVLGIDPGLAALGAAVVDCSTQRPVAQTVRTFRTPACQPLAGRVAAMWALVTDLVSLYSLDGVAIEDPSRVVVAKTGQRATNAAALGVLQVVGMIRGLALTHSLSLVELQPQAVKAAVGAAHNASKSNVKRCTALVCAQLPPSYSEHAADAVACAIGGARQLRIPNQRTLQ